MLEIFSFYMSFSKSVLVSFSAKPVFRKMFKRYNWFSCVAVLNFFAVTFLTGSAQNVPELEEVFFQTATRSLSIPTRADNKCFKEVPTILTVESPYEPIIGNGSSSYWTKYEVCCEGYKRYEYNWNICVPDCGRKCENGVCVAPDDCRCFPRHVKNDDGECVVTCPLGCLNGKCSYDGRCTCNSGYRLDQSGKFCRPYCREGCNRPYQNCTQPDKCECSKGYISDYSPTGFSGACIAHCNQGCRGAGQCKGPNYCQCDPGYTLRDGTCQNSKCNIRCDNGICMKSLADDYCQCFSGYKYERHVNSCIPSCTRCNNGVCIEPGVCKCFPGYSDNLLSGNCEPQCPNGCIGGICEAPNICKCPFGKVDQIGYCRHYGEKRCSSQLNGVCLKWAENF